jgi:ABC-type polysaccharide/polyol phosphate export permease
VIGYFRTIWHLRHFWMALVRSDLRSRYRRSMIGIGWSLLHPIAMTAILCTVFGSLFQMQVRTFCPFLISGLVTWYFIVAAVTQGSQCFFQGESYIRQVPAPLAIYPLRTVLGAGFHLVLGLLVALVLAWCMNGIGHPAGLVGIIAVLPLLFIFGWAMALLFGIMNVLFQDTQHLLEVGLQIAFYCTPIMYPPKMLRERGLGWVIEYNPVTPFLEMIRQPIIEGHVAPLSVFAMAALYALLAAAGAALLLAKFERKVIFYL